MDNPSPTTQPVYFVEIYLFVESQSVSCFYLQSHLEFSILSTTTKNFMAPFMDGVQLPQG